jgi:hypothetical protein
VLFDPPVAEFPPVLDEPPVAEFPPVPDEPPVAELPPVPDVPPVPELPPVAVIPPDPLPPVELAPPLPAAPPDPFGSLLGELLQAAMATAASVAIARIFVRGSIVCSMAGTSRFDHFRAWLAGNPLLDAIAGKGFRN